MRNRMGLFVLFAFILGYVPGGFMLFSQKAFVQEDIVCRHLAQGELDLAIEILNKEIELSPQNFNIKLYLGYVHYLKKDIDKALKELKEIEAELNKMETSARPFGDPEMSLMMGMDRKSKIILAKDKEGYLYYLLGLAFKEKKDFKNAEKKLRKAQATSSLGTALSFQLIDVYFSAGNLKNASRELEELKKLVGETPAFIFLDAYAAYRNNKINESMAAFEKVASELVEAKKNVALLHYNQGNYSRAVEVWADILEKNPDDPDALLNTGRALFLAGKASEAQEYFDRAGIKIPPANFSPKQVPLLQSPQSKKIRIESPCTR